jgi:hypothetical protein
MGGPNIKNILKKSKEIFDNINNEWIESDEIGVKITLVYPSTIQQCNNCQLTSYGIVYKSGGPAPFSLGDCPSCGGAQCSKENEVVEDIRCRLYSGSGNFSKFNFKKLGININGPTGDYLIIGKISDIQKIKNANYAILYTDEKNVVGHIRVELSSEPTPYGFGRDKFFFSFWSRV